MNDPFSGLTRRSMLQTTSAGFGWLAFQAMNAKLAATGGNPLALKQPHFAPKAKHVNFLCMRGAPSHVDTFDYKPILKRDTGKTAGKGRRGAKLLGSFWDFAQHGQGGQWISELFPSVSKHADDICIINGMATDIPNHPQAVVQMHTGNFQFVRPSLGAWTLYGLGTENDNLPGFITLAPSTIGGARNYGSAFLPAIYQGTPIGKEQQRARSGMEDAKLKNMTNPDLSKKTQRLQLDLIQSMNQQQLLRDKSNPEVEGIIESFELAFRMQTELPKVMDLSDEPSHVRKMYGIGDRTLGAFGTQCLLARRMIEKGVRFVELTHSNWDQHRNLETALTNNCDATDIPIAALLQDLKQRDLLKETLVIWGGEFGRTPHAQNGNGRDHNNKGYSMWMAGGGIKGGLTYGKTDEYGYEAVEDRMHIHDWHATILHLLGLNHEELTYNYAGRDFRLTDVHGKVARSIIA